MAGQLLRTGELGSVAKKSEVLVGEDRFSLIWRRKVSLCERKASLSAGPRLDVDSQ
jgi:hypothetical protein